MRPKIVAPTADIGWVVSQAPPHATIEIAPGEYPGPLIINHPLQLVGQGDTPRATTLWARYGPVVIVQSPDVVFENLNIEITGADPDTTSPAIWYRPGCYPNIRSAQFQGQVQLMAQAQNSDGWKLPNLIDLGDLSARQSVELPLAIEVPGPAVARVELSGAHLASRDRLPAAGIYSIYLTIERNRLVKNTQLAGQLIIESGGQVRTVWIVGQVLDQEFQQWARESLILVGAKERRYMSQHGILLGRSQFQGEPGAEQLDERHAYLLKEESGVWALIQPLPTTVPLHLNGQPLGVGRRTVIKGGETIKVGTLELKVAPPSSPPLVVPPLLDFGALSQQTSTQQLTIKKTGRIPKWEGQLRATVPWLQVPAPQVSCPNNTPIKVAVQLGSGLNKLPQESHISQIGALVLEGAKDSWFVTARLHTDAYHGVDIAPARLTLGTVSDPSAISPQKIRVRNVGTSDWQGTVSPLVPWLTVAPTTLSCGLNSETSFEVSLNDQLATLNDGAHQIDQALRINSQDGTPIFVPVALHYTKPRIQLDIQPILLDWGRVSDWRTAPQQSLTLRNSGNVAGQCHVEVKVPWLDVKPASITCPPGGHVVITAALNANVQNLPAGEQKAAALQLKGDDGYTMVIAARAIIESPPLQITPARIDMVLEDRRVLPQVQLKLHNPSSQPHTVNIVSTLRWLEVLPPSLVCPPRGDAVVQVTVSQQAADIFTRPRTVAIPDAIKIEGSGPPLLVPIHLLVKSPTTITPPITPTTPPPPPPPHRLPEIDFGRIGTVVPGAPSRTIQITNTQGKPITGKVTSTVPWLTVAPDSFLCLPDQDCVITAHLTPAAMSLTPGRHKEPNAIKIEDGGQLWLIGAQVEIPATVVLPPPPPSSPPIQTSESTLDFGPVHAGTSPLPFQTITLQNTQTQLLKGSVRSTVAWLTVTPTAFVCPPGQHLVLTVQVQPSGGGLLPGLNDVPDAIVIEGSGAPRHIRVQLHWTPPKGQEPQPQNMGVCDFGVVENWYHGLPVREIRIGNGQKQRVEGRITSTLPWLRVTPEIFACEPGQEIVITASLTQEAMKLLRPKTKPYLVPNAIVIEGEARKYLLGAQVEIQAAPVVAPPDASQIVTLPPFVTSIGGTPQRPQAPVVATPPPTGGLAATPAELDFGEVAQWDQPAMQEIRLINSSGQALALSISSTVPWLEVTPDTATCPPGGTLVIQARLKAAAPLRPRRQPYKADDAIVVTAHDAPVRKIAAQVTVQ